MTCAAPRCPHAAAGGPFCPTHAAAPAGRRGGWLSAARRRAALGLDASRVVDRLWIGGRPPAQMPLAPFAVVALCAAEYQPTSVAFVGDVVRARLRDHAPSTAELAAAGMAGTRVAAALRRGERVLVTCDAGTNRAGLVAGIALLQVTQMTPEMVAAAVRAARGPDALGNPHFMRFLERNTRPTRGQRQAARRRG